MTRLYRTIFGNLILLIAVFELPYVVSATVQRPDRIVFEDRMYDLCNNPMEDYFKRFPDRQPQNVGRNTSLYRGYVATFEFDSGKLFLKDIEAFKEKWQSVLLYVVSGTERLQIDWYTGLLVMPNGDSRRLEYDEYDCSLRYESYIVLEIDRGEFVRSKRFEGYETWTKFRENQFKAFKKTQAYKDLVKDMRSRGRREDSIDPVINDFILGFSTKILVDK